MNSMSSPTTKLERTVCSRCHLEAPAPIVVDGKCANQAACDRRVKRLRRDKA